MVEHGNTLDVLHELIEVCKDGETGYAHAAGIVADSKLKSYFQEQSLERARFVKDLKQAAEDLGVEVAFRMPDAGTSVAQQHIINDLMVTGIKGLAISPNDATNLQDFLVLSSRADER